MAADDYDENGNEVWDEDEEEEEEEEEGGEFEVRNHISINSINFAYSSGKGPRWLKSSASFLNCRRFITTLILLLQPFDIFTERRPEYPIFDWGGLVIGQEGLVFGQEEEAEAILIMEVTGYIYRGIRIS